MSPSCTFPGAPFRATGFPVRSTAAEYRSDGTILLRDARTVAEPEFTTISGFVPRWAEERGSTPVFCERDPRVAGEPWRCLTWAELWHQVQVVGALLLECGFDRDRPVMILSGNSIEQAVLVLAADYIGLPTAPVSPPYSLMSQDHVRLKAIAGLVRPQCLFVQSARDFARALSALDDPGLVVIAVEDPLSHHRSWRDWLAEPLTPARRERVRDAHLSVRPELVARILFTSGSTGVPKGVPLTYRNLRTLTCHLQDTFGWLRDPQPVFVDWLPWHHGMGGVINVARLMLLGGSHYIDDGRPTPAAFSRTVRNLHDVQPTVYGTVPVAWSMLIGELERDIAFAKKFFARMRAFGYGGASLPREIYDRIQRLAVELTGERIVFTTALGSTETTATGTWCDWGEEAPGNIGVPTPGSEVKLVPLSDTAGRYEMRIRSAANFGGYLQQPELTRQAFDEEGFFKLGDAVRLMEPGNPARGLVFDGRVVEDFKLANGTWVRCGAVRLELLSICAPLVSDAVICGQDRDFVAALAWPDISGCRGLAAELQNLAVEELVRHPRVLGELRRRLSAQAGTASVRVERLLLMPDPPSADANEVADKGYVNQAATRARRADRVALLYGHRPPLHVAARAHE